MTEPSVLDLLDHPEPGVRATVRAMVAHARRWGPTRAAEAEADRVGGVPLLGTPDRQHGAILAEGSETELEVCRWRTARDAHCACFRCEGQEIEVVIARAIVSPCGPPACYWCAHAGDESHFADGIVTRAKAFAKKARAA